MEKNFKTGLLTSMKLYASLKLPGIFKSLFALPFVLLLLISSSVFSQADLMIRDCMDDETSNGAEPSNCTSAIYASDGIKVLQNPHPGYTPYPFTTGPNDAWTQVLDEDAQAQNPAKFSKPNYIYVKVTNPITAGGPSNGTEVLKVYWAKGSTGLSWNIHWFNAFGNIGTCPWLYLGDEVTKPRRNWILLSSTEREQVVNAFKLLDQSNFYLDNVSWWDKQDEIHEATHVHTGPEFLPWHRELVNRLENLLTQTSIDNRNLKLPYWDWTTDPRQAGVDILDVPNPNEGFGASWGLAGAPFNTFDNGDICDANTRGDNTIGFACAGATCPQLLDWTLPPRAIKRFIGPGAPQVLPDNDIIIWGDGSVQSGQFDMFRIKHQQEHNKAHTYFGGSGGIASNIACEHGAFEDPMVYLLHSNVDKIFSKWQRHLVTSPVNEHLYRLDKDLIYGSQLSAMDPSIEPWDGIVQFGSPIFPWNSLGGEILTKSYQDESVIFPPIYDDALLTIPILQPGESVIMQIPWYPPNPDDYDCFTDKNHFCILARIETSDVFPFGMTTSETNNVGGNTYHNNNIAWKNIQIYPDMWVNSPINACVLMRNMQKEKSYNTLRIVSEEPNDLSFFRYGSANLILPERLFTLWVDGGKVGENIEVIEDNQIKLLNEKAWIGNLLLSEPGEGYEVCIKFELNTIPDKIKEFHVNLEQEDDSRFIGGEQFKLRCRDAGRMSGPINSNFSYNSIYPNPSNGNMQLDYNLPDNEYGELNIYYYDGRTLATYYLTKGKNTLLINEPQLSSGMYVYQIRVNDKVVETNKLVIIK